MDQFAHHDEGCTPVVDRQANGHCVYLLDGKCSVYARRPRACRDFDCRLTAFAVLAGYTVANADDHVEADPPPDWRFTFDTIEDHAVINAFNCFDLHLPEGYAIMPEGLVMLRLWPEAVKLAAAAVNEGLSNATIKESGARECEAEPQGR